MMCLRMTVRMMKGMRLASGSCRRPRIGMKTLWPTRSMILQRLLRREQRGDRGLVRPLILPVVTVLHWTPVVSSPHIVVSD